MKHRIVFKRDTPDAVGYWQAIHGTLGVWIGPSPAYKTAAEAYAAAKGFI